MKNQLLEKLELSLMDVLEIISETIEGGTFFIAKVTDTTFSILDIVHKQLACNLHKGDTIRTEDSY